MIETFNLRDSYRYYRKTLLKARLRNAKTLSKEPIKESYNRLPVKLIEKLEIANGIEIIKEPSEKIYNSIVQGYLKFIVKKIFEGHDIRLGAKLGIVGIRGKKIKPTVDKNGKIRGIAPSWGKTFKLWNSDPVAKEKRQMIYCFNEHSDGIKYRIVWYKKSVIVKNKIYYGLTFTDDNRKMLWKLANEGKEYLVIE